MLNFQVSAFIMFVAIITEVSDGAGSYLCGSTENNHMNFYALESTKPGTLTSLSATEWFWKYSNWNSVKDNPVMLLKP